MIKGHFLVRESRNVLDLWLDFDRIVDQIFGQVFDHGFGEGNLDEHSAQFYRALKGKI